LFSDERDPAQIFFNPNVKLLLKKLTRVDFNTVFRKKRNGLPLRVPEYKFLTTEELNEVIHLLIFFIIRIVYLSEP
jgi:hypothetical protein